MASTPPDDTTLKKGTAELLILAQLEHRPSHGYEIAQQIDVRSRGTVSFHVASLYPILYRLERRPLGRESGPAPAPLLPAHRRGPHGPRRSTPDLARVHESDPGRGRSE